MMLVPGLIKSALNLDHKSYLYHPYLPTALGHIGAHAALGPGGRGSGTDIVPVCSSNLLLGVGVGRDAVLVVGGVR